MCAIANETRVLTMLGWMLGTGACTALTRIFLYEAFWRGDCVQSAILAFFFFFPFLFFCLLFFSLRNDLVLLEDWELYKVSCLVVA